MIQQTSALASKMDVSVKVSVLSFKTFTHCWKVRWFSSWLPHGSNCGSGS